MKNLPPVRGAPAREGLPPLSRLEDGRSLDPLELLCGRDEDGLLDDDRSDDGRLEDGLPEEGRDAPPDELREGGRFDSISNLHPNNAHMLLQIN
ncbi:MAG: hypothetical protein WDO06_04590 [Actinomycetota bacterium]